MTIDYTTVAAGLLTIAAICILIGLMFRRSRTNKLAGRETFDLTGFRRILTAECAENPQVDLSLLAPLLDGLQSKYGNNVPIAELKTIQQFVPTELARIEVGRQAMIDRGAREGKTIEIESLRQRLESYKAEMAESNREVYSEQMHRCMVALRERYGNRIPVDHAYRIMKDLEAGRGFREVD